MLTRARISLGILAGGRASRLGGADKALALFEGQSLLSRTLVAMGDGFAQTLISYNGAADTVLSSGNIVTTVRVVPDLRSGFPGPLGGLEAMLQATTSEWLLTLPVDLRYVPANLCELLCAAFEEDRQGKGVVVRDGDGLQPVVALWSVGAARPAVQAALNAGERAMHSLQHLLQFRILDISPTRFGNLNTYPDFE